MSKMDNLRAMREARYEESQARARASAGPAVPKPQAPPPAPAPRLSVVQDSPTELPEPEAALCGHRAISGRTCTREAGHTAKSHRYA
jgi:hypothetical protein